MSTLTRPWKIRNSTYYVRIAEMKNVMVRNVTLAQDNKEV